MLPFPVITQALSPVCSADLSNGAWSSSKLILKLGLILMLVLGYVGCSFVHITVLYFRRAAAMPPATGAESARLTTSLHVLQDFQ